MRRLATVCVMASTMTLLLVGCGGTTSNVSASSSSQKVTVDPKQAYVDKLNSMGIRNMLKIISEYGTSVQSLDETNQNDVQELENVDATGIPKYQSVVTQLKSMSVPKDYQQFNTELETTLSEFVQTMQYMDKHLKTPGDTTNMAQATAHYISSTNAVMKLSKLLPFDQLQ